MTSPKGTFRAGLDWSFLRQPKIIFVREAPPVPFVRYKKNGEIREDLWEDRRFVDARTVAGRRSPPPADSQPRPAESQRALPGTDFQQSPPPDPAPPFAPQNLGTAPPPPLDSVPHPLGPPPARMWVTPNAPPPPRPAQPEVHDPLEPLFPDDEEVPRLHDPDHDAEFRDPIDDGPIATSDDDPQTVPTGHAAPDDEEADEVESAAPTWNWKRWLFLE